MKVKIRFFLLFSIFLILSCFQRFSREQINNQLNLLKGKVLESLSRHVTVNIFPFKNTSSDSEIDYLSNAIPEAIYELLYNLEYETAYIPFDWKGLKVTKEIEGIIKEKNSYLYKYTTNIQTILTQYTISISNYTFEEINAVTNEIKTQKSKKIKLEVTYITNKLTNTVTNYIISNITKTNMQILPQENLIYILSNEISNFSTEASYLGIKVTNHITTPSNITTNEFYVTITGSFFPKETRKGFMKTIEITIIVSNFLAKTNAKEYRIVSREDKIHDNLLGLIKEARRDIINQPVGDIIVETEPSEASIYIDGIFYGKTPLYFPSIKAGTHKFTLKKDGYDTIIVSGKIINDYTNRIFKDLKMKSTGGIVKINSFPTNSKVFLNSEFAGFTPIIISNISLNTIHRVMIYPEQTNLLPSYHSFKLSQKDEVFEINSRLKNILGTPTYVKKALWGSTFFCWGITASTIGLSIYYHYLSEYAKDTYYTLDREDPRRNEYKFYSEYYDKLTANLNSFFLFSGVISMSMTAIALSAEEIYFGIELYNNNKKSVLLAEVGLRY